MTSTDRKDRVLVTGGAGFLGAHCVRLLAKRKVYQVVATVRNLERDGPLLRELCPDIELHALDLIENTVEEWRLAARDCKFCLHVASPFFNPAKSVDPEKELIRPAVEGTRTVLTACHLEGVEHVAVTSSMAAVLGALKWSNLKTSGSEPTSTTSASALGASTSLAEMASKGETLSGSKHW
ncbi:unnamed protein product, partial [Amoebophrya sp. A25]|eukprot:GSA25T00024564001.1